MEYEKFCRITELEKNMWMKFWKQISGVHLGQL